MGKETEKRVAACRDALEDYTLARNGVFKGDIDLEAAIKDRDAKQVLLNAFSASFKVPAGTSTQAKEALMWADAAYQKIDK
jgi:hypothetical protein